MRGSGSCVSVTRGGSAEAELVPAAAPMDGSPWAAQPSALVCASKVLEALKTCHPFANEWTEAPCGLCVSHLL